MTTEENLLHKRTCSFTVMPSLLITVNIFHYRVLHPDCDATGSCAIPSNSCKGWEPFGEGHIRMYCLNLWNAIVISLHA